MKIVITFLLIFTIFSDFTSATVHEESSRNCTTIVSCPDIDLHSSNSTESNEAEGHHDHCHQGHSHNAVTSSSYIKSISHFTKHNISFPIYQLGKTQNYSLNIIRPPIA